MSNRARAERRAEDREIDELLGVAADGGAHVEHDDVGAQGRPDGGDRRARDAFHGPQAEGRHGHQRAGVAAGNGDVGLAVLDGLQRHPHRGFAFALAQGLGGLFVHRDDVVAVEDPADLFEVWEFVEERRDLGFAAVEQERRVAEFAQSERGALDGHLRADIAAHGVDRYADCICHSIRFGARNATAAPP